MTRALTPRVPDTLAAPGASKRTRKPTAHAAQTKVTIEASQRELRVMLEKHGATRVSLVHDSARQTVGISFALHGQLYQLALPLPRRPELTDPDFRGAGGLVDYPGHVYSYEARCRERWRAIVLWVKGALEMVRLKLLSNESAFMPGLVLPNGDDAKRALAETTRRMLREKNEP